MELDSIIYIIIAIVLAIVNAVAQKKKKAAREQAINKPVENVDVRFDDPEDEDESPYPAQEVIYTKKSDPFEMLFGEELIEEEGQPVTFTPPQPPPKLVPVEEVPELTDFQLKMQELSKKHIGDSIEHSVTVFDEDSIAASAIGDAPTEEEEQLAISEARSDFMKEFEAKKAIVYSEIIKPKYFSVGVNS